MSIGFIKLVSELNAEKYSVQLKNVVTNKVPCALFYGFSLPKCEEIIQHVNQLKNVGFNLTTLYLLNEEQMDFVKQSPPPPSMRNTFIESAT